MACEHDVKILNRGDLNNHSMSAYECGTCGTIGFRKWGTKGLGPMKWDVKVGPKEELGLGSQIRMSMNRMKTAEMNASLTSERRFEKLMGVR